MVYSNNIASLLRNGTSIILKPIRNDDLWKAIPELYQEHEEIIPAERGFWRVNYRNNFAVPNFISDEQTPPTDGFCAVYTRGIPHTLFVGSSPSNENVNIKSVAKKSIDVLTRKVLEPPRFYSSVPRLLNEDDGQFYALGRTLLLGTIATSYLALQAGPEFPSFVDFLKINAVGGAGSIATGMIFQIFGLSIGSSVDKWRIKDIPTEAHDYLYGQDAEDEVISEHRKVKEEIRKNRLYFTMLDAHPKLSKEDFAKIYRTMGSIDIRKVSETKDKLNSISQNKIPLDYLVDTFS